MKTLNLKQLNVKSFTTTKLQGGALGETINAELCSLHMGCEHTKYRYC